MNTPLPLWFQNSLVSPSLICQIFNHMRFCFLVMCLQKIRVKL